MKDAGSLESLGRSKGEHVEGFGYSREVALALYPDKRIPISKFTFKGKALDTPGAIDLYVMRQPERGYVIVISAERYRIGGALPISPPTFWGGPYYAQAIDLKSGDCLGKPVTLPLSPESGRIHVYRLAEDTLMVAANDHGRICFVHLDNRKAAQPQATQSQPIASRPGTERNP